MLCGGGAADAMSSQCGISVERDGEPVTDVKGSEMRGGGGRAAICFRHRQKREPSDYI